MTTDSLRTRLSLWIAGLVLGVTLIAGAFAWWSATDLAQERQDENLGHLAALIAGGRLAITAGATARRTTGGPLDREFRLVTHELGQLDGAGGQRSELAGLDIGTPDGLQTVTLDGLEWRVFVTHVSGNSRRIAVGQPTAERDEEVHLGGLRTVVPLLVLMPILLLVITDLIGRLLAPVRALADALDARSAHDLSPLAARDLPAEIRPFATALDGLLARAREAASVQRRFVADAAHELRTPLTALTLQAERLLASNDLSDEARGRALTLLGGIERAQALVRQLLTLARAHDGADADDVSPSPTLDHIVRCVIEDHLPIALERHVDIGVRRLEPVEIGVPENALLVLLGNLVGNAVRYTPAGGHVDVDAWREGDTAVLQVSDTGPGIPLASRERVFDAFHRERDRSSTEGSGLGLSIVRTLAERHGATVTLADGPDDVGLRVTVTLPARPRSAGKSTASNSPAPGGALTSKPN